jgi:hypothetical protein
VSSLTLHRGNHFTRIGGGGVCVCDGGGEVWKRRGGPPNTQADNGAGDLGCSVDFCPRRVSLRSCTSWAISDCRIWSPRKLWMGFLMDVKEAALTQARAK